MIYNVPAIVKDVKVTAKGITVSLEGVKFKGEQLTDFAALIGSPVILDFQIPQMSFDDMEDDDNAETTAEQTTLFAEDTAVEEVPVEGESDPALAEFEMESEEEPIPQEGEDFGVTDPTAEGEEVEQEEFIPTPLALDVNSDEEEDEDVVPIGDVPYEEDVMKELMSE